MKRKFEKYRLTVLCMTAGMSLLVGCQGTDRAPSSQTYQESDALESELQAKETDALHAGIAELQQGQTDESAPEEGDGALPEQMTETQGEDAQQPETEQPEMEQPETEQTAAAGEEQLPEEFSMEFMFASGAGAWGTSLLLNRDGSFAGGYHDSEMGDQGEGYPHGSVYISDFTGTFTDIKRINDYTWSMTLGEVKMKNAAGEEWIEEEIRYVASEPYGLDEGREFLLYLPQTPVEELDEDFLSWWPDYYPEEERPQTLSCYGIYNMEMGYGFFAR